MSVRWDYHRQTTIDNTVTSRMLFLNYCITFMPWPENQLSTSITLCSACWRYVIWSFRWKGLDYTEEQHVSSNISHKCREGGEGSATHHVQCDWWTGAHMTTTTVRPSSASAQLSSSEYRSVFCVLCWCSK